MVTDAETSPTEIDRQQTTTTPRRIDLLTIAGWLHSNVRNVVLICLLLVVCYLALKGVSEAVAAVLATFSTLAGSTWGSRDALKIPGKDS